MYRGPRMPTLTLHTWCTIPQTLDMPTPNSCPIDQYLAFVPSLQNAIRWSTGIGECSTSCFFGVVCNSFTNYAKVVRLMWKFLLKLASFHCGTMSSKKDELLGLTQSLLCTGYPWRGWTAAAIVTCEIDSWRKAIIALSRLCAAVIRRLLPPATRSLLQRSQEKTNNKSRSWYTILKLKFCKPCPTRIQSG